MIIICLKQNHHQVTRHLKLYFLCSKLCLYTVHLIYLHISAALKPFISDTQFNLILSKSFQILIFSNWYNLFINSSKRFKCFQAIWCYLHFLTEILSSCHPWIWTYLDRFCFKLIKNISVVSIVACLRRYSLQLFQA